MTGKTIRVTEDDDQIVQVDRTSWLDLSLGRFHQGTIAIPRDIDLEYAEHLKTPVKIYEKDRDGNPTAKYVRGGSEDHYAHSRNYSEIALPLAASIAGSQNMRSPI